LDTFEPAPRATQATPATGSRNLAAAFRADTFSGFVDGFEGAVRAPVNLSGGLEPIIPEAFEVTKPTPVAVSTGFVASLDDLFPGGEGEAPSPNEPESSTVELINAANVMAPMEADVSRDTALVAPESFAPGVASAATDAVGASVPSHSSPASELAASAETDTPGAVESASHLAATELLASAATDAVPSESRSTAADLGVSGAINALGVADPSVQQSAAVDLGASAATDSLGAVAASAAAPATLGVAEPSAVASSDPAEPEVDLIALAEVLVGRP